jgi:hypothetical protein
MAIIILSATKCPLCDKLLQANDDLVSTSHFIESPNDPLWRYSDAAMHRQCFLAWELRSQFVSRYNQIIGTITWGNGTYHHMTDDGTIQSLLRNE